MAVLQRQWVRSSFAMTLVQEYNVC